MTSTTRPSATLAGREPGVLARAKALIRAAHAGEVQRALTGKHICLVCSEDTEGDAPLFAAAATELGAKVSLLRPWLTAASPDTEIENAAQILGRLYDGIALMNEPRELIERINRATKIPVLDVTASARALVAEFASDPDDQSLQIETRHFVIQAMLLDAIC